MSVLEPSLYKLTAPFLLCSMFSFLEQQRPVCRTNSEDSKQLQFSSSTHRRGQVRFIHLLYLGMFHDCFPLLIGATRPLVLRLTEVRKPDFGLPRRGGMSVDYTQPDDGTFALSLADDHGDSIDIAGLETPLLNPNRKCRTHIDVGIVRELQEMPQAHETAESAEPVHEISNGKKAGTHG